MVYGGSFTEFQVSNLAIDVDNTGTYNEFIGLPVTDPRILNLNDALYDESHKIGGGHRNTASAATVIAAINTFQDMVFGTGIIRTGARQRFRQLDGVSGLWVYTGLQPFVGMIDLEFTALQQTGIGTYDVKFVKSEDGGATFADLGANRFLSFRNAFGQINNYGKNYAVSLAFGDQVKPQIRETDGLSDIIFSHISLDIRGLA